MIKINSLEIENVKRIKAVSIVPNENGLTVIGGNNNQGKTSVLDTICWALGGERYRPSNATREGSAVPPKIRITMSNGLIVERSGKNSALKVTDPSGRKSGQQLLNEFVSELALNLPKFLQASAKEKADILLQIIGVGPQLQELEQDENRLYNQRTLRGREYERKKAYADGLPFWPNAPGELVSISDLIRKQQEILARNGENQRKRDRAAQIRLEYDRQKGRVASLEAMLEEARSQMDKLSGDMEVAQKDALDLVDECTDELERQIADFESINKQVRDNMDRDHAMQEAKLMAEEYNTLTTKIESIRKAKIALLDNAALPLPGLGVEAGELTYHGKRWDCMSGSDQLRVATAIVRAVKPSCSFVLLDKLEQLDLDTLREFGGWLEQEGLQAIATRVSTGDECSVIIEDGHVVTQAAPAAAKTWKEGVF